MTTMPEDHEYVTMRNAAGVEIGTMPSAASLLGRRDARIAELEAENASLLSALQTVGTYFFNQSNSTALEAYRVVLAACGGAVITDQWASNHSERKSDEAWPSPH